MKLEELRNVPFRAQDLKTVFPDCKDLPGKIKRLEQTQEIIRMKRGWYVVAPTISREMLSPYLIANHIYGPSYISMETALRFYGLIPEAVYQTISVTLGVARSYMTPLGSFRYIHATMPYYATGITMATEAGISFLIATPEKALCDLIVFTPRLNLRYREEVLRYLEEDIRLDMDDFARMDISLLRACAASSRKKPMINQLIKLLEQ
jgi:predicted transcriptional regulator of viral defense system